MTLDLSGLSFLTCETEIAAVPASKCCLGLHDLMHTLHQNRDWPSCCGICGLSCKMRTRGLLLKNN